jgi:hypothetical protein
MRQPGNTSGGLGTFLISLVMIALGAYLILENTRVSWGHGGMLQSFGFMSGWSSTGSFGITLIPLLFGIAFLFFNYRSPIGWILLALGALLLFAYILMNLRLYWQQTSLFSLLVMLTLLVGGIGLLARSLFPMGARE